MTENRPNSKQIATLYSYDTEYSADSVEWCPHDPHKNFFVCANYQLDENSKNTEGPCKRLGRILLFSVNPDDGLRLHQTIDTAAVLDQKWCHNKIDNRSLLGVVNAKKTIEIYQLNEHSAQLELVNCFAIEDDNEETLILSLDWSTGKYESSEPEIICSDSKGNLHRFSYKNSKVENSWHAHEFEAWISAFYYWDPNVIFSGGDDSAFLKFDKRVGIQPVAKNKSHEAGVTSLHSNAKKEHILASGSYDSFIRIWDTRYLRNPLNSIKMPGTLWRLKWDPFCHNYLLSACMHGGVHVIDATNSDSLEIVESYYEHKNISYGADWSFLPPEEVQYYDKGGNVIIGTCSFYDHLLCVSKLNCDLL